MRDKNYLEAAKILFNHRLDKKGLKNLPEKLQPHDLDQAYKIQNELKILYLSLSKNESIGKKVGCTNKIAQEQLDIFEPFYGSLFSRYSSENHCKLKSTKFYKPFIEPEISFKLKKDININDAPFSFDDAKHLFKSMLPSLEIVDFRFGENIKEVGIKNLISTNGASEYWIKGNEFPLNSIDLNDHSVKLYINDNLLAEGNTNLVLNNPINSAIWLINKLANSGEPMLKNQFISTGTCTPAMKIVKNNFIKADFGTLGNIELNFI